MSFLFPWLFAMILLLPPLSYRLFDPVAFVDKDNDDREKSLDSFRTDENLHV